MDGKKEVHNPDYADSLAKTPEHAPVFERMRKHLLGRMRKTKHPAANLMADSLNPELIAEYMAWKKANATK